MKSLKTSLSGDTNFQFGSVLKFLSLNDAYPSIFSNLLKMVIGTCMCMLQKKTGITKGSGNATNVERKAQLFIFFRWLFSKLIGHTLFSYMNNNLENIFDMRSVPP